VRSGGGVSGDCERSDKRRNPGVSPIVSIVRDGQVNQASASVELGLLIRYFSRIAMGLASKRLDNGIMAGMPSRPAEQAMTPRLETRGKAKGSVMTGPARKWRS